LHSLPSGAPSRKDSPFLHSRACNGPCPVDCCSLYWCQLIASGQRLDRR
jgi:hypothetical protein